MSLDFSFLTLYVLIHSSFWFDTINLGWSIVYIVGSQVINRKSYMSAQSFIEFIKLVEEKR